MASQLQLLLQSADQKKADELAIKFIEDNFPSWDALNNPEHLDSLVNKYASELEGINDELLVSQENVDSLIDHTRTEAKARLEVAQGLALVRHSLQDELTGLYEELLSFSLGPEGEPTLLERIETEHRRLKELESVKAYVQVIETALRLSEEAVEQVHSSSTRLSEDATTRFKQLQEFVMATTKSCEHLEDGAGHGVKLLTFLRDLRNNTWGNIKGVLFTRMLEAAEQFQWPTAVDYPSASLQDRKKFEAAFLDLLILQTIGVKLGLQNNDNQGIYPLQALVQPIQLRFKYHFDGNRETNRIDKPEWYFSNILGAALDHRPFVTTVIQQLFDAGPSSYRGINAWREYTLTLLPILNRKIKRSMPSLLSHPALLAHTIYQALAFDNSLKEGGFGLVGTSQEKKGSNEWQGTIDFILGMSEWAEAWVGGEKTFADDQYSDIVTSTDAWQITDDRTDGENTDELRPTNSARRVKALLEQITDRYRPLPRLEHRVRFLASIQIPILEQYRTRVSESLDAFEMLSSSFLFSAVPGALTGHDNENRESGNMTSGVEGIQRLVKAYVSTKWIEMALSSWGEDLFFLELWKSICENETLRTGAEEHQLMPDPYFRAAHGTVFDVLRKNYSILAARAEGMVFKQMWTEIEPDLKAHLYRKGEEQEDNDNVVLSPTLVAPLARLTSFLSFFQKHLPPTTVTTFYRRIASHIASYTLQRGIIYRGRGHITYQEGKAIHSETNLWIQTCRMALGQSVRRAEGPWQKLYDAGIVLSWDKEEFMRMVNVATLGTDESLEHHMDESGILETSREEFTELLRLREEYP